MFQWIQGASAEKGVKWKMMVPVTKMGTPVDEKLNLGFTAAFRLEVCKQSSAISDAHMQWEVSQQKLVHMANSCQRAFPHCISCF